MTPYYELCAVLLAQPVCSGWYLLFTIVCFPLLRTVINADDMFEFGTPGPTVSGGVQRSEGRGQRRRG